MSTERTRAPISLTDLPSNVLVEILARLPLRTLLVARSVCKTFVFLTTHNPHFITLQSSYADQILVIQHGGFRTPSCLLLMADQVLDYKISRPMFQLPNMEFDFKNPPRIQPWMLPGMGSNILDLNTLYLANSCNGLLYFVQHWLIDDDRSLVCNPVTSEYIIIPDVDPKMKLDSHTKSLWLGFSPGTDQYKVLRIFSRRNASPDEFTAQVYVIGSDSWRDIDDTMLYGRNIFWDFCHAVINGLMYWHYWSWPMMVISFDFEREKFGEVALPAKFQDLLFISNHETSIGVLGGFLCMSCNNFYANRVDLWVMRKCGNREYWTKEFVFDTVGPRDDPVYGEFKPLQFLRNGEILILWHTGRSLVCYDPRTKILRYFRNDGIEWDSKIVALTPSFVPLKDTLKVDKVLTQLRPRGDENEL